MEDIPIGLILEYGETLALETETETFLGAITEPPTEERGGATQTAASQQYANANDEGRLRSQGVTVEALAGACPS